MGNIYLSVNAKDVAGSASASESKSGKSGSPSSASVVLSCKTSPSMIDAVNSEVSSAINSVAAGTTTGAGAGSNEQQQQQQRSLIDTSTCAATCSRCGTYVGDGQIIDQDEEEGEEEGEPGHTGPHKGHFVLADLSNIRFIRHRIQWRDEKKTRIEYSAAHSEASHLLRRRMTTEQVVAHLLTAASSLYGSSSFELYVPDVPR